MFIKNNKKLFLGIWFYVLQFLPNIVWADDSCHPLLKLGLYNVTQTSNATDAQAMSKSTFCSFDYNRSDLNSQQSASIEASYGLFSGNGSGSASRAEIITTQRSVCTSGFNSSSYSNTATSLSRTVYQGTLDSFNRCQDLANRGLVFDIQPSSTLQGLTTVITPPTGSTTQFFGVTQYGSGHSNCTTYVGGRQVNVDSNTPFVMTAANKVTVTCTRQMRVLGNDLIADAQDLVFVTSAAAFTVPLASVGSLARSTTDQIKAEMIVSANSLIDTALVQQKNSISSLQSDMSINKQTISAISSKTYITADCRVAQSQNWDEHGISTVDCSSDEVRTGGGGDTWCNNSFGGFIHMTSPTNNGWIVDQDQGSANCSRAYAICCKKS